MAENREGFNKLYGEVGSSKTPRGAGNFEKRETTVPPSTPDEEQGPVTTEITVLVAGKRYTLTDDGGDLEIRNKLNGMGISIQENGDIMMLSGSGGNGKACGGRFIVNSKGGQLIKSGSLVAEYTGNSNSSTKGGGSDESSTAGKNETAKSEICYGDSITEVHGEVRIKGTNIVLEAADVLSLIGKSSVLIQAGPNGGGELRINAGQITETCGTRVGLVTGQKSDVISEEVSLQYDPRASVNVISPGHMNVKAAGDISLGAGGAIEMIALGLKNPLGLIKDPVSTIGMKTVAGGLTLTSAAFTNITALGPLTQASNATTITSTTLLTMISGTGASILTGTGNVDITATKGNVNVKGLLIYLN
jgi:hypothetical protein